MDSDNHPLIDINQADEEALTQLRGVGSRLARRIIAERPFETVDDLRRVRGISEKDVERLRPNLSISTQTSQPSEEQDAETSPDLEDAEAQAVMTSSEEIIESPESEDEEEVLVAEAASEEGEVETDLGESIEAAAPETEVQESETIFEPIPVSEVEETPVSSETEALLEDLEPTAVSSEGQPSAQPKFITSGRAFGLVFLGCFFTLILAIAISLGILSSLNRGQLTYASPSQVNRLQTQLNGLATQSETLANDLEGLRSRVDNLEALSGRVNDIESEITSINSELDTLQSEIDTAQAQYDELSTQIVNLDEEIETLRIQSSRFESFLKGLQDLMQGLFPNAQE